MPAPGQSAATCGGVITSGSDSMAVRYSAGRDPLAGLEPHAMPGMHGRGPAAAARRASPADQSPVSQGAHRRLVADRQALGDEDRPAHAPAERTAYRDLERAEDRAWHALPDVDPRRRDSAAAVKISARSADRLTSTCQLIPGSALSGSETCGGNG